MQRRSTLTLGIDTNKLFEREIQLSAFRSLEDFQKRKIKQQSRVRNEKERWIQSLKNSLKPLLNTRNKEAIQRKYHRISGFQFVKNDYLSQSQTYQQKNFLQSQGIRRRSCVCQDCGQNSNKVHNLSEKVSTTMIMQFISQAEKKKTIKQKTSIRRLASKMNQSVKRQQTVCTLALKTKFGDIILLPEKVIETFLKRVQQKNICQLKKKGSKDDLQINFRRFFQFERKSLPQLDKIKITDSKEEETKKHAHHIEESESEYFSKSPSICKKSTRCIPAVKLEMQVRGDHQRLKKEVVMKHVLQRNRLTANQTINKFLILSKSLQHLDISSPKSYILSNKQIKDFQHISLNSLHCQSQKIIMKQNSRSIYKINSAKPPPKNKMPDFVQKTYTSQSARKKTDYHINNDQLKSNYFVDTADRQLITQKSERSGVGVSKLEEIYKKFEIRTFSSRQQQRKPK